MSRLEGSALIDRGHAIGFRFNGRDYRGLAGDTLSSALLANGVTLVGRSFKYHRPRGIVTAGLEEPNALVTLRAGARAEPNVRATGIELYEGLEAWSQNCWPSPNFDLMAVNQLAAPLLTAGFYYKTFKWPSAFWETVYEPIIRRAAGLGKLSGAPDPDRYDRNHAFADVLVVGAGPAGLAAALAAAGRGARVLLLEDDASLGGRLLSERHEIDGVAGPQWAKEAERTLEQLTNVTILKRTTLAGAYDGGTYAAIERVSDHLPEPGRHQPRQRYWKIVAPRAILAMGAIERPIVFGGNDRPGVMMASAIQTYVNRFAVAPGRRVAIYATSDSGHQVAADLDAAGVEVVAIIDPRMERPGIATHLRHIQGDVVATFGKRLRKIEVRDSGARIHRLSADVLGMAGGWNPAIGVASHLGYRPYWCDTLNAFRIGEAPRGMAFAGAAAGALGVDEALAQGQAEGLAATPRSRRRNPPPHRSNAERTGTSAPHIVNGCRQTAFVDFQNDVTADDVLLAEREGYRSIEHLKRYTTLGMATDQGKASQVNGHAILARACARAIGQVGTIASRPPYTPVALGALAGMHRGPHLRPTRHTALHAWSVEQGATFVDAGLWKRPQWFSRPGEADWLTSTTREAKTVRSAVGLCDVSTLGKIEVGGSGAPALLDRLYANMMSTLPIGKCRYGVMLREDGFVFDDGTVARLAEDRYVLTTTTANAVAVMRHIDFAAQVLWPDLDVQAMSVTEQWAQVAVAGPQSRALLQDMLPDIDLSNEAFPYLANLAAHWRGFPIRLFRLSFSGELAYEIAVPANQGDALVRALASAGERYGCSPYGTEALSVLRIEKGHAAGGELNGQVTAGDLGLARMLSTKKDFIGRTMAQRPALTDPGRLRLVGLRPVDPVVRFSAGSHLLAFAASPMGANSEGHVTSVCFSPALDQWIGLGLLVGGAERHGERVRAVSPVRGADIEVEVCAPIFLDPDGEKLRG